MSCVRRDSEKIKSRKRHKTKQIDKYQIKDCRGYCIEILELLFAYHLRDAKVCKKQMQLNCCNCG